MFNIFQTSLSLLVSSVVLLAMGFVALFLALLLRQRSRAIGRIPRNLSVAVFSTTFNVFDPNPEHRRIIGSHTGLVVFTAIYGSWVAVTFAVFKAFEFGAILGCIVFLICAGLLMIDETLELNANAGKLVKAVESGVGLAQGDMRVLSLLSTTLPRMSKYHFILAVLFSVFSITLPLVVDVALTFASGIASVVFVLSALLKAVPTFSLLVIACMFASILVIAQVAVNKTKKKIFRFPAPIPIDIVGRQFHRMKTYVGILHHHPTLREPQPEETERANERDIEQHSEH